MNPSTLYIILNFLQSFTFSLIFTVNQLYFVTTVGMTPLELVLMGTIIEASIFLFEIPTGIVADMKSRRLSVIIGFMLMGLGFIIEGLVPVVLVVGLVQLVWGLGFTFTSGALEAWISDEIGEEKAGDAYLRGGQWGNFGGLVAIPFSVLLGAGSEFNIGNCHQTRHSTADGSPKSTSNWWPVEIYQRIDHRCPCRVWAF